jgi:hypothetical protein
MRRRSEEAAFFARDSVQGFRLLQDRLRNQEIGGAGIGDEKRIEERIEERIEIRFEERWEKSVN